MIRHCKANKKSPKIHFVISKMSLVVSIMIQFNTLASTFTCNWKYSATYLVYIQDQLLTNHRNQNEPFQFRTVVYQGDPLSPIIFLRTFNPILEVLQLERNKRYALEQDNKIICTPFADTFNPLITHKRNQQILMDNINTCPSTMGLKLISSKCRSFSIILGKPSPLTFIP